MQIRTFQISMKDRNGNSLMNPQETISTMMEPDSGSEPISDLSNHKKYPYCPNNTGIFQGEMT